MAFFLLMYVGVEVAMGGQYICPRSLGLAVSCVSFQAGLSLLSWTFDMVVLRQDTYRLHSLEASSLI